MEAESPSARQRIYRVLVPLEAGVLLVMVVIGAAQALRTSQKPPPLVLSYLDYTKQALGDGDFEQAAKQMRLALQIESGGLFKDYELETSVGSSIASHGDLRGALEHLNKALELNPDYPETHYAIGTVATMRSQQLPPEHRQGVYEEAERRFKTAISLRANYAAPQFGLARLYEMQGKSELATVHLRKAVELSGGQPVRDGKLDYTLEPSNADFARACNMLTIRFFKSEQLDRALEYARQAIDLDPEYAEAHNNLAQILLKQDKTDEAIEHLKEALRINPKFSAARRTLDLLKQRRPGR